jgi:hypothetical protein
MTLALAEISPDRLTTTVYAQLDRAQARNRALRQNASVWTSVTMHTLTRHLLAENDAQIRGLRAELQLMRQRIRPMPPPLPKRLVPEAQRPLEPYFAALDRLQEREHAAGVQLHTWFVPETLTTVVFPCVRLPDGRTYELGMLMLLRHPLSASERKTSEELFSQLSELLARFEATRDALVSAWPDGAPAREGARSLIR